MSQVSNLKLSQIAKLILIIVYILKENGAKIVHNLDQLGQRTEFLINQGTMLRQDVKKRKVEVMTQIDENFDKIIHHIL